MTIPNTQIKDGWYFNQASSTFTDLYLGPKLSYLWRYLHKDFIHFANSKASKGKNWLYSYTKSAQVIADEVGYRGRRQTVTEQIKELEAKGLLCRIPCISNGNQGKAIVTFDPASVGYEAFVFDVVAELKKKSDEGSVMADEYLRNFMSNLTLWKTTSAEVNKKGDTVAEAMEIIHLPEDRPEDAAKKKAPVLSTTPNMDIMRNDIPDDEW